MNSQDNVFDYRTLDSLLPYLMFMNIKILLKYVYFSCLKFYHNNITVRVAYPRHLKRAII